jgi:hypothetical protein
MFQQLRNLGQSVKTGFNRGVELQDQLAREKSANKNVKKRYSHSVIPGLDGGYYEGLNERGINMDKPAELAGAIGARLLTDVADDASRHTYWRYNHPMAIGDVLAEQIIGDNIYNFNSAQRAAIELGAIGVPVASHLGVFDITNPGELGRPKGFAQSYAEVGSEDRRETANPAAEVFDRYVFGRRGRPLKYETAKEDIPDLTKQRYSNYMNTLYNDKTSGVVPGAVGIGLAGGMAAALGKGSLRNVLGTAALGSGIGAGLGATGAFKATTENLEGKPEAFIAGFPVGLESVGGLLGGAGAVRATTNPKTVTTPIGADAPKNVVPGSKKKIPGGMSYQVMPSARKVFGYGVAGAAAGIIAGKMANSLIAAGARRDLPSTDEYGVY